MYSFTNEEMDELRKKRLYRITNDAWNRSSVNHPDNVGYLIGHISDLQPKTYEEWEKYFYKNIANENKLIEYAERFRDFVFADSDIMKVYNYHHLHFAVFYKMVVCRLIYETWLGYSAEVEIGEVVAGRLRAAGHSVRMEKLSPKDDNKYAVDFLLFINNRLLCGVQVKSENYIKSNKLIVQNTIKMNKKKNKKFEEDFGVPVKYAFYKRVGFSECVLVNNDIVQTIENLI